jgi:dCTP deaminase
MLLNDRQIRSAIKSRDIVINPAIDGSLQPASWDLHLGNVFIFYTEAPSLVHVPIDPWDPSTQYTTSVQVPDDGFFLLRPNMFVLATTIEQIRLSSEIQADVDGKSGPARLAMQVEAAGKVDAGYEGNITLEIKNLQVQRGIVLRPGMAIAQISFTRIVAADRPYGHPDLGSHYQGQVSTTAARELAPIRHLKLVE